jgi:hypothetical protein
MIISLQEPHHRGSFDRVVWLLSLGWGQFGGAEGAASGFDVDSAEALGAFLFVRFVGGFVAGCTSLQFV